MYQSDRGQSYREKEGRRRSRWDDDGGGRRSRSRSPYSKKEERRRNDWSDSSSDEGDRKRSNKSSKETDSGLLNPSRQSGGSGNDNESKYQFLVGQNYPAMYHQQSQIPRDSELSTAYKNYSSGLPSTVKDEEMGTHNNNNNNVVEPGGKGQGGKSVSGIQIKLVAPVSKQPAPKVVTTPLAPKSTKLGSVFNVDDDDDEEEMPPECKMRMKNIGRDTPTSAGPNSFGKTKIGFCNVVTIKERQLEEELQKKKK